MNLAATEEERDALRIVHAASAVAALPGMVSSAARDLAARRLREMMHTHPSKSDVLAAIVVHLESYL